jgi:DNA-binding response OmpR family regulator
MQTKILTVDDSNTLRKLVKRLFSNYSVEFFEAGNGLEGLEIASKQHLDLILLDITMPIMDGVTMLTKLRESEKTKHTPVIILTAYSDKTTEAQVGHLGAIEYMIKPFEEESFVKRIRHFVKFEIK